MIIAFFLYIIFNYFLGAKKVINLCSLTLLYIMVGIYIGESSILYSSKWIKFDGADYIYKSIIYLKVGFYICVLLFSILPFFYKEYRLKKSKNEGIKNLFLSSASKLALKELSIACIFNVHLG